MTATTASLLPRAAHRFVPATLVGSHVRELLDRDAAGRVIGAFSGAIYIAFDGGSLAWIGAPGGVPHGRALLAPVPAEGDITGQPVKASAGDLVLGDLIRIGAGVAPGWSPPAWPARVDGSPEGLLASVDAVARTLNGASPAAAQPGTAAFLASMAGLPADVVPGPLWPLAGAGAVERVGDLAGALLGLGPGLTPSGDDFIGGLLFSLRVVECFGASPGLSAACRDRVLSLAARRTTAVSIALLADYGLGEGPEPLHRLVERALVADAEGSVDAARDLVAIGQTTGQATLAGFAAGIISAFRPR